MVKRLIAWLSGKSAGSYKALYPTKKVKIEGIIFVIRKINPLDYLAGYKAVLQGYDTYQAGGKVVEMSESTARKMKEHYVDVFTSAVVEPKLVRKMPEPGQDGLYVEALFNNWPIVERLYEEIMIFTYGKKKLRSSGYLKKNLLSSTS